MSDLHANYLLDLGSLLREQAEAAALQATSARGTDRAAFYAGRKMAYYEVVSLLVEQAAAFELPLADISCEGFDPDRLLKG